MPKFNASPTKPSPYAYWPWTLRGKALRRALSGRWRRGRGRPPSRSTRMSLRSTLPHAGGMVAWENELLLDVLEAALTDFFAEADR